MSIAKWKFYDLLDRNGNNLITAWVNSLPSSKEVRDRLDQRILFLKQLPITTRLDLPQARFLHGKAKGLVEIRFKAGGVERRPLGCLGPGKGEVTLLIGAYEQNKELRPPGIINTALGRIPLIYQKGRIEEHVLFR